MKIELVYHYEKPWFNIRAENVAEQIVLHSLQAREPHHWPKFYITAVSSAGDGPVCFSFQQVDETQPEPPSEDTP